MSYDRGDPNPLRGVTVDAIEASRGERLPFEAHVRQELERINEKLDRLLVPPQTRHASDLNRLEPLLDMAAVWDRHRHRRREEGT